MSPYVSTQKIIDEAENSLVRAEADKGRVYVGGMFLEATEKPRQLEYQGQFLSIDELRAIYDKLSGKDQGFIKALAIKFVEHTKRLFPYTSYNFDDGLLDVARWGLWLHLADKPKTEPAAPVR